MDCGSEAVAERSGAESAEGVRCAESEATRLPRERHNNARSVAVGGECESTEHWGVRLVTSPVGCAPRRARVHSRTSFDLNTMANPLCFAAAYSRTCEKPSSVSIGGGGAFLCSSSLPRRLQLRSERRARARFVCMAASDPSPPKKTGEESAESPFNLPNAPNDSTRNDGRATSGLFGIRIQTNGDVIKFGFVAIAIAYAFKFGLTSFGVRDILAGQITTGVVSVASLLAWVST